MSVFKIDGDWRVWTYFVLVFCVVGIAFLRACTLPKAEKPVCECKAEACPLAVALDVPCSCPICPVQPTLEVRKPLSAELDAAKMRCEAALAPLVADLEQKLDAAYAALKVAKDAGVTSQDFAWLDDGKAQVAVATLLTAWQAENRAGDAVWSALMKCRDEMAALFHATDAWVWVDSEEMDEHLAGTHGFEDAFHETIGYEYQNIWCNVGARRLECPIPKPQPVEEEN